MKRIVWLGAFTLSFLILLPSRQTQAGPIPADAAHGFGWLKAKALNCAPWIHQHGPLYNYGPYDPSGVGYNYMQLKPHHVGNYVPAYPYAYYNGGYGAAAYPQAPAHAPHPIAQAPQTQSDLTPVGYNPTTIYPSYFGPQWPAQR